jgi:hypothetical protein
VSCDAATAGHQERYRAWRADETAYGRAAELHARNSHGEVYGVDINTGVESAYRDLSKLDRPHFVQADSWHSMSVARLWFLINRNATMIRTREKFSSVRRRIDAGAKARGVGHPRGRR